ncbi:MAG: hypothetical protein MUC81_09345 [Bacteroidia bacterium]|jgi:hemolysin III|nr:hypothetical protein [Bacteroidia bacterium]
MVKIEQQEVPLPDGGIWYTETNPKAFIVEPFNALSAVIFIGIAAFWFYKLGGRYKNMPFLFSATVLLAIGAIGGSIYHAFRYAAFFIMMDWLPILILCLMAACYFLWQSSGSLTKSLVIMVGIITAQVAIWMIGNYKDRHMNININYALMGLTILGPLWIYMRKTKFKNWLMIVIALGSFILALGCRIYDNYTDLSIGTHFLWHGFGAIACHQMFRYIYHNYYITHPAQ